MTELSRRRFLQSGLLAAGALSFGPGFWRKALAAEPATAGVGPYGPLLAPDANGIMLPEGFSSRVVARANALVPGTGYLFPIFPDGASTFPTPDGGWILAVNSEVPVMGGASAIRFRADGSIAGAYRILSDTSTNCAGGATPWGTWLSCEEVDDGRVWECDPTGARPAVVRPALGVFKHEAACVDPDGQRLYLTEDVGDGGLYRFTPEDYPDLSAGTLEIATDGGGGRIAWVPVPDPLATSTPTRAQVPDHLVFRRGEGIWFDSGVVYIATTGDETVHAYDVRTERIEVLYRADDVADAPLRGVDNLCVSRSGDIFVAEDSYTNDPDAMDVCLITPDRVVSRFLKLTGPEHNLPGELASETAGVCFDPSGNRMYLGSQRAWGFGVVYEITGPFREAVRAPATPGAPIGVDVAGRIGLGRFVRRGLPVGLTLDEAATVHVRVTARRNRRAVTLGRIRHDVDRGPETLRVRPSRRRARELRRRRGGLRAQVEVRIVTPGAPDRVVRRTVRMKRKRSRRR